MSTQSNTRIDQAYVALRRAIIEQALKPGDKLREDEIGSLFSMSRTLVRQVLARLSADGLVITGGKRSAMVATPSLEDALAIFEVRRALEREVVALALKRWKPNNAARLEAHVKKEEGAARGPAPASIRMAGEFHTLLAEMSGNLLLVQYVHEVVTRCSLILAVYGRPHSAECGVQEHRDIIHALKSGDLKEATRLMDRHVGDVEARALITVKDKPRPSLSELLAPYADLAAEDQMLSARRIVLRGGS